MAQIITDSSTLHRVEEANALGVETLPLCVNIDDLEGRDLQMDMKDFYKGFVRDRFPEVPSRQLVRWWICLINTRIQTLSISP